MLCYLLASDIPTFIQVSVGCCCCCIGIREQCNSDELNSNFYSVQYLSATNESLVMIKVELILVEVFPHCIIFSD